MYMVRLKSNFIFVSSYMSKHIDMCAERDSDTYKCVGRVREREKRGSYVCPSVFQTK